MSNCDVNSRKRLSEEEKMIIAEQRKEEGNRYYRDKNYNAALNSYTAAINLCTKCAAYYSNRAATYIMLASYERALNDARQSLQIDCHFVKAHLREAKCHVHMGEPSSAIRSCEAALRLEPDNKLAQSELKQAKTLEQCLERAKGSFGSGDYRLALFCCERALEIVPNIQKYKVFKSECLALLGRLQESEETANDILATDNMDPDALYVRGLCFYYHDRVELASQQFQQVLRLVPDHSKALHHYKLAKALLQKKDEGNNMFREGHYQRAYRLYSEALTMDSNNSTVNAKLYCNRAAVCCKLMKFDDAIQDCTSAIGQKENYVKAYKRRAMCYMELEHYEEAVRDYEKVFNLDNTRENRLFLEDARLELSKSNRKDYYKVLGVHKSATAGEIRKAYKKRALQHHPDRHSNASEERMQEEEKKFKDVGEAYSVLSHARQRLSYDTGSELADLGFSFDECYDGEFCDIDPGEIFSAFYGDSYHMDDDETSSDCFNFSFG